MAKSPADRLEAAMARRRFWRAYAFDDADGFNFERAGERIDEKLKGGVRIFMPVAGPYRLRLDPAFDVALHELNLYVAAEYDDADDEVDDEAGGAEQDTDDWEDWTGYAYEIGHWDQARWHPWCLRWEEAQAVVAYMRANPSTYEPNEDSDNECTVSPDMAMLLLSRFVGHEPGDTAGLEAHRAQVAEQFVRMGVFDPAQARRIAENMVVPPPEDDYTWTRSDTHGWMFGGAYTCYSNRNTDHSRFPFEHFARFRVMLGLDAKPRG
jgi:hypothetical protein